MMRTTKSLSAALLAALLLSFTAITAEARSWRINSDATKKPHFTDINAAMSSSDVVAGDTLYLDPGTNLTSQQTVSKQVTIIGCGYFLNGSMPTQAIISGNLTINAPLTKVEGVLFTSTINIGAIKISANNVTIERCKMPTTVVGGNNCTIRQCFITSYTDISSISGLTMYNNIISYSEAGSSSYVYKPFRGTANNATIQNNLIVQYRWKSNNFIIDGVFQGCIIKNNILLCPSAPNNIINGPANCIISNNILSCAENTYPSYPDNLCIGTADNSVLFSLEGTNDQRYRLKEDSPAKGYASDGGDCGPFGGMYPYVPSGLPLGMPYFESSAVPTRPQEGQLRVTQKVVIQGE